MKEISYFVFVFLYGRDELVAGMAGQKLLHNKHSNLGGPFIFFFLTSMLSHSHVLWSWA